MIEYQLPAPLTGKTGWPWTSEINNRREKTYKDQIFPKITIVTPSFNQGEYIEETIRSVLMQGYPNLEYIIIDGGSTDESVEIIKKYEPWLSYWESKPDRGQTHALNKGFAKATGDWLAWLNSDDLYLPRALFTVVEKIKSRNNCHWLVGTTAMATNTAQIEGYFEPVCRTDNWLDFVCTKTDTGTAFPQPSSFWSRQAWDYTGDLNESLHFNMDHEYWCRLAKNKFRPICLSEPLAIFRIHEKSKTSGGMLEFLKEELEIFDQWIEGSSGSVQKALIEYKEILAFNTRAEMKRTGMKNYPESSMQAVGARKEACRSCGSEGLHVIDRCREFDTSTKYNMCLAHAESLESGSLYHCSICGLGMRVPCLSQESLDRMNSEVSPDDWANDKDVFEKNSAWVKARDSLTGRFDSTYCPKVLDIGCYTGKFLRGLPDQWNKFAIEPTQAVHAELERNNITVIDSDDSDYHCVFDVVCLIDVFEHTIDPYSFLNNAMQYVKYGGLLIVSTGNLDSWSWRLIKGDYWYLDSPLHISFATPDFFSYLCRKHGSFSISGMARLRHTMAPLSETLKNIAEVYYFWLRKQEGFLSKIMKRLILMTPGLSYLKHKIVFPYTFFIKDHLYVEMQREGRDWHN